MYSMAKQLTQGHGFDPYWFRLAISGPTHLSLFLGMKGVMMLSILFCIPVTFFLLFASRRLYWFFFFHIIFFLIWWYFIVINIFTDLLFLHCFQVFLGIFFYWDWSQCQFPWVSKSPCVLFLATVLPSSLLYIHSKQRCVSLFSLLLKLYRYFSSIFRLTSFFTFHKF